MTDNSAPTGPGDQTILVGETIYLRTMRLDNADSAPIWRPEPFPACIEIQQERLKETLETGNDETNQNHTYLILRRGDDRPLGSAKVSYYQQRLADMEFSIDPARPLEERGEIAGATTQLLLTHLDSEAQCMEVASTYIDTPEYRRAANAAGMRLAMHQREVYQIEGSRHDSVGFEWLNPVWIDRLGSPPGLAEGPVERKVRAPARRLDLDPDNFPVNCVIPGERIYLRVFEPDEAEKIEEWSRSDTEAVWSCGRFFYNSIHYSHFSRKIQEKEPPEWIRFAIALRDSDELIGLNGLYNVDWINQVAETESEIFLPEYRGKGYGTEAKHLLLQYAFERIGLHMVYSWVAEPNRRSAAALRKQGYRDCGYYAWTKLLNEGATGEFVFDLLASEWRAARDNAAPK